jgi:hypothetical protein
MNALAGEVAQLGIEERLAAFPNLDHQPHDGITVRIGHPFGGPDRVAFHEAGDDLGPAG